MTGEAEARESAAASYSWKVFRIEPDGRRRLLESGEGKFGTADPATGRICQDYIQVGTAVFDRVCGDLVEEHHAEVLDARIEGVADPVPEVWKAAIAVCDQDGVERMTSTADLRYREVGVKEVDDYRKDLALWEKRERQRHERCLRAIAAAGREMPKEGEIPRLEVADPRLRGLVLNLRVEADTVREEVPDLDHCREQLMLAENTVAAALSAERTAQAKGDPAEALHARAYVERWTPRIARWAAYLELTTEAYADAASVDALADRLSLITPPMEC
ncbi:hypothetical protein NDR87_06675 [Nocardia sp. CDC159]|uniref:Uncharacterized protein n=1 Tax=Nocardia pulmonis TaxID=2951408 RepID=A0A9X2IU98_9NOCA|nr:MULTISPECIES: hypothetical protein [Nocardia]MCM6772657.1 hypothetical protein [Nocardia pulmonis]MCM6786040.1 hypothetical protein [Nocardia sp. CDC159]